MTSTWDGRTRSSAYAAVVLAVLVLLLTLHWNSLLVVATGVLATLLAALSMREGLPAGSCPSCRARPRRQTREEVAAAVIRQVDDWLVSITVDRLCTNCRESRRLVEEIVVPRVSSETEAEALVLARSGRIIPNKIRSGF